MWCLGQKSLKKNRLCIFKGSTHLKILNFLWFKKSIRNIFVKCKLWKSYVQGNFLPTVEIHTYVRTQLWHWIQNPPYCAVSLLEEKKMWKKDMNKKIFFKKRWEGNEMQKGHKKCKKDTSQLTKKDMKISRWWRPSVRIHSDFFSLPVLIISNYLFKR